MSYFLTHPTDALCIKTAHYVLNTKYFITMPLYASVPACSCSGVGTPSPLAKPSAVRWQ